MILLAESGATRSHWVLISRHWSSEVVALKGFNPNYHDQGQLIKILKMVQDLLPDSAGASEIIYYGSGCAGNHRATEVGMIIANIFPLADVKVLGDLLAAARGLFGQHAGIAVILGTGSNAGLYNGQTILRTIPSLGYIMGDEGSGTYLGKQIVRSYVTGQLPELLAISFERFTGHKRDSLIQAIYSHPEPGNFLASFAPFLSENIADDFCERLVVDAFTSFLDLLKPIFNDFGPREIAATGSVAANFSSQFRLASELCGFDVRRISSSPFTDLLIYHQQLLSE